jgi:hypothetical protein
MFKSQNAVLDNWNLEYGAVSLFINGGSDYSLIHLQIPEERIPNYEISKEYEGNNGRIFSTL